MVVSAGKKADLQRVGMLSSLREISVHVATSLMFSIMKHWCKDNCVFLCELQLSLLTVPFVVCLYCHDSFSILLTDFLKDSLSALGLQWL